MGLEETNEEEIRFFSYHLKKLNQSAASWFSLIFDT